MAQTLKNNFYSPLRYPGGKRKLAPFIKSLIKENSLDRPEYIEPYAGGAGVALSLLLDGYVSKITINDYDRSIYACWRSMVNHSGKFCQKIRNTQINIDTWKEQREIQRAKDTADLFALGFSTFFLNRTNISGVIKGGPIGGLAQNGNYTIDARFNKEALIKRIEHIAKHKDKITITKRNALNILNSLPDKSFVYLDPPYVEKANGLYMNFYKRADHEKIAQKITKKGAHFYWLLSYDKNPLIDDLYKSCKNKLSWGVDYGSSNKRGAEDIFLHEDLLYAESQRLLTAPSP